MSMNLIILIQIYEKIRICTHPRKLKTPDFTGISAFFVQFVEYLVLLGE